MNILFITLSPIDSTFSMAFRNRSLISGFLQNGHYVDVLTVWPYDLNLQINNLGDLSSVNIIRLNKKPNESAKNKILRQGANNIVSRVFRKIYNSLSPFDFSFLLLAKVKVKILPRDNYDIVVTSSDPKTSHLVPRKLVKDGLKYGRWIQYWGDPLALDITSKLIYPKFLVGIIETNLISKANKIVYVSPITLRQQKNLLKRHSSKMHFLPIGYEKKKIYQSTSNDKFIVGYFGFYIQSIRNIIPLYNAISNSNEGIYLNIVGYSDLKLESNSNVSVFPNSNYIDTFESKSDLIIVILNIRGGQIPGKIYHLAATNKPVLIIIDGEYASEIKSHLDSYKRFITCNNDELSIMNAINYIRSNNNQSFSPVESLSSINIASNFLL